MRLTKYRHACFTIEKDDQILVVDPGGFSTDFIAPEHVIAVVVTHEHPDHFDPEQLAAIIDKNPDTVIIAHETITSQIEAFQTRTVARGDSLTIGSFDLAFTGGEHALIHTTIPVVANLGVVINDLVYYPGDSFVLPGTDIDTLALPAGAPWMKAGDAMNFLITVKPRYAFPTHDALLSDSGNTIADRLFTTIAEQNNIIYSRLTDSIEI